MHSKYCLFSNIIYFQLINCATNDFRKAMISPFESESSIISGLLEALQEMPKIEIVDHQLETHVAMGRGVDAQIQLEAAGRIITLFVEIKHKAVYPRDVREILWRLRETDLFPEWGMLHARDIPFPRSSGVSGGIGADHRRNSQSRRASSGT